MISWRKSTSQHSSGEILMLNKKIVIGSYHWNKMRSKGDELVWSASLDLPGADDPGKFKTEEEARDFVELKFRKWLIKAGLEMNK